MKRHVVMLATAASLGLAACGGTDVVVQASVERADGSATGLRGLLVRALPYDRDSIFAAAERAYGVPEPTIPDSLLSMRNEISTAQEAWSHAETLWGEARDSLKALSDRMQGMDRATPPYHAAYREFMAQDSVVLRSEREFKAAYARFTAISERYARETDALRRARAEWESRAFAGVDSVIAERVRRGGRPQLADTTDANGVARFAGLKGKYWLHARYELPYQELYWNVPVEAKGREPVTVQLNRNTAQVRPGL